MERDAQYSFAAEPEKASLAKKNGRPRDTALDHAILEATIELLGDTDYASLSFEQVARKAETSRPAIYRRWPTKAALVNAALEYTAERAFSPLPSHLSAREKLSITLQNVVLFAQERRNVRLFANLMAAAHFYPELSDVKAYLWRRRGTILRQIILDGVANGEFPPNTSEELLIDLLQGPILFRTILLDLPVNAELGELILDQVLPPDANQ